MITFVCATVGFAIFLALHAPLRVIVGLWLVMMAWEAYDLHPDHALYYSVLLGGAAWSSLFQEATARAHEEARR